MAKFKLYSSIAMPSTMNGYSMACAYMERWFMKRFNKEYFKAHNVDESHMSRAFNKAQILKNLKALKPSVFIIPKFDFDFDREGIDVNLGGIDNYTKRDVVERSFFKDKEKNMYLFMELEQLKVDFTFRVRVSTRPQQLDLFRYMQSAFRIKQTQQDYIDMDFHIPNSIMIQLAMDSGFELDDNNKIKNIPDFLAYVNKHTAFPILYKYRSVNGDSEFFIRLNDLYVHISCLENLSADDGEYEGQIKSNYIIEMNSIIKIPVPKFYVYFSENEHETISSIELNRDYNVGLYNIKLPMIPDKNDKGWEQYLYTEIFEDDTTKQLEIEFEELFKDGPIGKLIDNSIKDYISPSTFMEIKLYNNNKEVDYTVDWETKIITSSNCLSEKTTYMAVYVDLQYVNEQITALDSLYKDKLR